MEWKKVLVIALIVIMIGSSFLALLPSRTENKSPTSYAVKSVSSNNGGHMGSNLKEPFKGKITNIAVRAGTFKGMGVYDKSCQAQGNGLTGCDAGIKTEEFGTLNFNYQHNMQLQPCLAPNDLVQVQILDDQGNAIIQRI